MIGKDFGSESLARASGGSRRKPLSRAVHPRLSDNRPGHRYRRRSARARPDHLWVIVGVSVLVERIGRRLSTIEFSDRLRFRVLDQNGGRAFRQRFQAESRNTGTEGKRRINQRDPPEQKRAFRAAR